MRRNLLLSIGLLSAVACAGERAPTYCASLAGGGTESDARDPEATGDAILKIDSPTSIRFFVRAKGVGTVVATHIHRGSAGTIGPMAHELNPGFTSESIRATARNVPPELVQDIERDPSGYYVKLHSLKFPGGAIRGQLHPCRDELSLLSNP